MIMDGGKRVAIVQNPHSYARLLASTEPQDPFVPSLTDPILLSQISEPPRAVAFAQVGSDRTAAIICPVASWLELLSKADVRSVQRLWPVVSRSLIAAADRTRR